MSNERMIRTQAEAGMHIARSRIYQPGQPGFTEEQTLMMASMTVSMDAMATSLDGISKQLKKQELRIARLDRLKEQTQALKRVGLGPEFLTLKLERIGLDYRTVNAFYYHLKSADTVGDLLLKPVRNIINCKGFGQLSWKKFKIAFYHFGYNVNLDDRMNKAWDEGGKKVFAECITKR